MLPTRFVLALEIGRRGRISIDENFPTLPLKSIIFPTTSVKNLLIWIHQSPDTLNLVVRELSDIEFFIGPREFAISFFLAHVVTSLVKRFVRPDLGTEAVGNELTFFIKGHLTSVLTLFVWEILSYNKGFTLISSNVDRSLRNLGRTMSPIHFMNRTLRYDEGWPSNFGIEIGLTFFWFC